MRDKPTVEIVSFWRQKGYGTPILLNPVAEVMLVGDAIAKLNAMTGDWLVTGQKGSRAPYVVREDKDAAALCLSIDHYNRTGEIKKFSAKIIRREATPSESPPA